MNCDNARQALIEYLDGAPGSLPADLQEHLDACLACSGEMKGMKETWSLLGHLGTEASNEGMRARFYAMLDAESRSARPDRIRARTPFFHWWPPRPAFQAALMAAMLVIGVMLGTRIGDGPSDREAIRELQDQMQTMARAVTLSLLEHQSASERIRAVGMTEGSSPDAELVRALLKVINNDPSVNVRLAALDVLAGIAQRPEVRDGLLDAFPKQESAPMQAAMGDVLLAINGPRSRAEIQKAMESDVLPNGVRDYLRQLLNEGDKGI
jgi:hypothetical protein